MRKLIHITLLLGFGLCFALARGQSHTFQIIQGDSFGNYLNDIKRTLDNNYIMVGGTESQNGYVLKMTEQGDTLWTRKINSATGVSVISSSDGGYVVGGALSDGTSSNLYILSLTKLNGDGDTLWTRSYGGTGNQNMGKIIELSNGDILIVGNTLLFGAGWADIFLARTDASGNLLWSRAYGTTGTEHGYSVTETNDGNFVLAADGPDGNLLVMKVDGSGSIMWAKSIGGNQDETAQDIIEKPNGNLLVCGEYWDGSIGTSDALLGELDATGNVLWLNRYDWGNEAFRNIVLLSTGEIVVGGNVSDTWGGTDPYIVKLNANGNSIIFTKRYGYIGNDGIGNFVPMSNGGFLIAGGTESFSSSQLSHCHIIKTDSMGNSGCYENSTSTIVLPHTYTETNISLSTALAGGMFQPTINYITRGLTTQKVCEFNGIEDYAFNETGVSVYPNPFSTSTTFEISSLIGTATLSLFDQLGREVKRIEGIEAGKHELSREGLSSGFYYYSLHNREGRIASGKLIVD